MKFKSSHEWFRETDGCVGISNHAQGALGEIVYVDLPEVGDTFDAGETFSAVESVKAASDVYMPVSGEVVEVNSALSDNPGLINESAEGEGWFVKIKAYSDDTTSLLDAA